MTHARTTEIAILRSESGSFGEKTDMVAVEQPLEMYLDHHEETEKHEPFAITMRTPGHDRELIAGLLYSEGIVSSRNDIERIQDNLVTRNGMGIGDAVKIWLKPGVDYNPQLIERTMVTTSSCGFCGRITLPAPPFKTHSEEKDFYIQPDVLHALPHALRQGQVLFKHTGAIHAAALFDRKGLLLNLFEDVGRHNAMDKLVGNALLQNKLPFSEHILCFSGRVSYELVQKAVMTGVPVVASIGAPSSLAIEMANQYGITLIGFVKTDRFNVYTHTYSIQSVN